ncbi:MFS transporter, partial [Acetobacter nitrogenifigens]|uniref:MFS transporter n=1 Tax=Acetobacter nitrogenifigens TaxID=285268 RepID=UPI002232877B
PLAAIAPDYWLFAACLVVIGGASLTFTTTTNSLMQLSTTPAMRGRVMALRVGVALGGTPVGAPIIGWLADHCGPRWALGIGALSGFLASIVAMRARTGQPPDPRSGSASERARTDKITIRDER